MENRTPLRWGVCVKHLNRCKTSTSIVFSCVCLLLNLNFNFVGFTAHLHVLCFIDCNQFPDDSAREFRRIQRSFAWFVVSSILITSQTIQQGDHPCAVCDCPTKRPQYMRISRLITVTYLLIVFFSLLFYGIQFPTDRSDDPVQIKCVFHGGSEKVPWTH